MPRQGNQSEPEPEFEEESVAVEGEKPTEPTTSEIAASMQDEPSPAELDDREAQIKSVRKEMGPPLGGDDAPQAESVLGEDSSAESEQPTEPDETPPEELSDE